MGEQIRINELEVIKFGGIENKRINFASKGLTVIYGENEMGKSTAADLITYLLTGYGLDNDDVHRFGNINDRLEGKLYGSFQGQEFVISRSAKVGKARATRADSTINFGEEDLTDEVWQARLGYNVDTFESTYRLRGETLFSDKQSVITMIDALASGTDGFSIPNAKENINKRAKAALTAKDGSYRGLGTEIENANKEIRELERARQECVGLDREKNELGDEIAKLDEDISQLQEEIGKADEIIRAQNDTKDQIETLEEELEKLREENREKIRVNRVSLEKVRNFGLSEEDVVENFKTDNQDLFELRTKWATEFENLGTLQERLNKATDEKTAADAKVSVAETAWEETTNIDYQDWGQILSQYSPSSPSQISDTVPADKGRRYAVPGGILSFVLAVISALVMDSPTDWIAAIVFSAIGLVSFVSGITGQPQVTQDSSNLDEDQSQTKEKLTSLYGDIIDARRDLSKAKEGLEREELSVKRQESKVDQLKNATKNTAETRGIQASEDVTPEKYKIMFDVAKEFLSSHSELRKSEEKIKEKVEEHSHLEGVKEQLASDESKLLQAWGASEEGYSNLTLGEILKLKTDLCETKEEKVRDLNQEFGARGNQLETLRKQEKWQELADRRSTLDEQRKQLLLMGASYAIAESLLSEVEQEFIRNNQPALLQKANEYFCSFTRANREIYRTLGQNSELQVNYPDAGDLKLDQLSTGARCSLYFALRLAKASVDSEKSQVFLPFICDDPLVHVDDQRISQIISALQQGPASERQIILFTCHQRILTLAEQVGASTIDLSEVI